MQWPPLVIHELEDGESSRANHTFQAERRTCPLRQTGNSSFQWKLPRKVQMPLKNIFWTRPESYHEKSEKWCIWFFTFICRWYQLYWHENPVGQCLSIRNSLSCPAFLGWNLTSMTRLHPTRSRSNPIINHGSNLNLISKGWVVYMELVRWKFKVKWAPRKEY